MYYYEIVDDNGTITTVGAKSRTEAIKDYCRYKGCPEEYVKEHCIVRLTTLLGSASR